MVAYVRPLNVDSKPKLVREVTNSLHRASSKRAARIDASGGSSGERPAAMESALRNSVIEAAGRNSRAKVVFPAPLGPQMMKIVDGEGFMGATTA